MHIYKSILCISLHVSVWILQIYTYIYVCMCIYIYSYLYLHIHMSQILTTCKVISYSHCKFKKRLHPSFKKNLHPPLQAIRFLVCIKKAPSLSTTFLSSCLSTDSALGPPELVQLSVDSSRESGRFLPSLRPNRGGSEKLVAMWFWLLLSKAGSLICQLVPDIYKCCQHNSTYLPPLLLCCLFVTLLAALRLPASVSGMKHSSSNSSNS